MVHETSGDGSRPNLPVEGPSRHTSLARAAATGLGAHKVIVPVATGVLVLAGVVAGAMAVGGSGASHDKISRPENSIAPSAAGSDAHSPSTTKALPAESVADPAGGSWGPPVSSMGGDVSCPSEDFCLTAADDDYATYDGKKWTSASPIGPLGQSESDISNYFAVSCPAVGECLVLDPTGLVATYSDRVWAATGQSATGGEAPVSLSCSSPSNCVAVDDVGRVHVLDTGSWSEAPGIQLSSVSCPTTGFCMGSGDPTGVEIYQGGVWSPNGPSMSDPRLGFTSVSCSSTVSCMVVGVDDAGDVVAFSYNKGTWSDEMTVATGQEPFSPSVSCASSTFCKVVEPDGGLATYNGTGWIPSNGDFNIGVKVGSLSCPSVTFCMAVGTIADDDSNDAFGTASTYSQRFYGKASNGS